MNVDDATVDTTKFATMNLTWREVYWETKNSTLYDQIYDATYLILLASLVATRVAIMEATYDEMTEIYSK